MKRVAPAIALFFIAPLVAEYLLGDIPINLLFALIFLAPMYGGGALLWQRHPDGGLNHFAGDRSAEECSLHRKS